jgi:DNA-binding MarR family transcriptional regulator
MGVSEVTVQRAWVELEQSGFVERRRRRGRRLIILLYTLAGQESRAGKEALRVREEMTHALVIQGQPSGVHALVTDDECTRHGRCMHSSPVTGLCSKEETKEEQQQGGGSAADVGVSFSHHGSEEEEPAPVRSTFLRSLAGDLAAALSLSNLEKKPAGGPHLFGANPPADSGTPSVDSPIIP